MGDMTIEKLDKLRLKGGVKVTFIIHPLEGDGYHFSLTLEARELDISTYARSATIALRNIEEE